MFFRVSPCRTHFYILHSTKPPRNHYSEVVSIQPTKGIPHMELTSIVEFLKIIGSVFSLFNMLNGTELSGGEGATAALSA